MSKINNYKTQIRCNSAIQGESIEMKMRRVTESGEPIKDAAEMIYTERKDGVLPEYDVRTDRFDVAIEAMDKVHKAELAKIAKTAEAIKETLKNE